MSSSKILLDPEDEHLRPFLYMTAGYPTLNKDGKDVYLHRHLMPTAGKATVDHKNRNKLDARKDNLRIATQQQQLQNSSIRVDNNSGFKGVSWDKSRKKWRAYINHNHIRIEIGRYTTKEEAALAYNREATKRFGEFANLNKVSHETIASS